MWGEFRLTRAEAPHQSEARCGINSAPAALFGKSRPPKKSFVFLLEEKTGARKSEIENKNFLLAGERQRAAAGRSVSFIQNRFEFGHIIVGARGGSRTRMSFRSKDFKSFVYTIPPPGHILDFKRHGYLPAGRQGNCPSPLRPRRELHSRIEVLQTSALLLGYSAVKVRGCQTLALPLLATVPLLLV